MIGNKSLLSRNFWILRIFASAHVNVATDARGSRVHQLLGPKRPQRRKTVEIHRHSLPHRRNFVLAAKRHRRRKPGKWVEGAHLDKLQVRWIEQQTFRLQTKPIFTQKFLLDEFWSCWSAGQSSSRSRARVLPCWNSDIAEWKEHGQVLGISGHEARHRTCTGIRCHPR